MSRATVQKKAQLIKQEIALKINLKKRKKFKAKNTSYWFNCFTLIIPRLEKTLALYREFILKGTFFKKMNEF